MPCGWTGGISFCLPMKAKAMCFQCRRFGDADLRSSTRGAVVMNRPPILVTLFALMSRGRGFCLTWKYTLQQTHIRCKSTVTILINSLITSSKWQQKLELAQEATKLTSNNMDFIWWDYNSHGMTEHTHSHTYMHTSNFLLSPLPPSPPTCRHAIR